MTNGSPDDTYRIRYLADRAARSVLNLIYTEKELGRGRTDRWKDPVGKPGYYPYIPFSVEGFVAAIDRAMWMSGEYGRHRDFQYPHPVRGNVSFIDVGCGVGDKLALAKLVMGFNDVTGIECVHQTAAVAKKRLGKHQIAVLEMDAFEYDFSPHNLIYMYHPIADNCLYAQLYAHIAKTIKPGAMILEVMPVGVSFFRDLGDIFEPGPNPINYPRNECCIKQETGYLRLL